MARTASGEHTDSVAEPPPPRIISAATPIALGLALSSLFGVVGVAYAAGIAHNRIEVVEKAQLRVEKVTTADSAAKEKEIQALREAFIGMQADIHYTRVQVDKIERRTSGGIRPAKGERDE